LAGVSEGLTKGYFAGGTSGFNVTTADKLTYSTDTTAAQTTADLSQARQFLAGVDNTYSTVFGDNSITSGNIASGQINNYNLSSGAIVLSSGQITSGLIGDNAVTSGNIGSGQVGRFQINDFNVGNNLSNNAISDSKGFFAGGNTGAPVSTADKLAFFTETATAQTSANLSAARGGLAGCSGEGTKGYFAGGDGNFVNADKLTYSTDITAAQTTARLSQARGSLAGISEKLTKGYFAGGTNDGFTGLSTAEKLTYSTDTTTAQTTARLSQARFGLTGCSGDSTKGYFAGGNTSGAALATADKLTYSTDITAAQTTANLSQARYYLAGCSGEGTKGYFAGGYTDASVSTADKLTYSTDTTTAQTTANLSQVRQFLAGVSEGTTKGYFAGGSTFLGGAILATADKLTYSTDMTAAQTSANLSQARYSLAGIERGIATTAVFGNNSITSGNIASGQIGKFHFSSGTTLLSGAVQSGMIDDSDVTSGNIASGQISTFHLSAQSVSSGLIGSGVVSRFKLSDQAIYSGAIASGRIPILSLSSGVLISSSFGNGSIGSGQILASSAVNSGGKIDSPHIASGEINSFNIASGAVNASSRLGSQSVFNLQPASIAAGASLIFPASIWTTNLTFDSILSGGISSGIVGNTKISDQGVGSGAIASGQIFRFHTSSGFINSGHFGDAALSSGSFNFGCVDGNSLTSGLWAVPYSQLVSGGIIAGYFDAGGGGIGSINNNAFQYIQSYGNAGYFAGGANTSATATTYKLTYSTDTTNSQTSAYLSVARFALSGCSGEGTKGYFAGGTIDNVTTLTTTDRFIYATATTTAQASANLSQGRYLLAGVSEGSTKGYFAGGNSNNTNAVTTADKITYAGDTTAAQTSAYLSDIRVGLAGCSGDSTKGYFAGGYTNVGGFQVATAEKVTYSTDTTATQTSANLSQATSELAGISEKTTKGYFAGGQTAGTYVGTAYKLTYSTDTTAAQTTANLSQARFRLAGVSEGSTKGYFVGGTDNFGNAVIADKLTYSTDATAAQTSANLSQATYWLAGVDGGISPETYSYNQVVISGKLTTTAVNKVNSTNFADNSVVSGDINADSIFSVIGGYTPFTRWFSATRRAAVNSGHIPSGEIGPSHFARQTLISGNFSSGLFILSDLLGDPIRSGNIGDRQIGQIHFSSNFIVTSSMFGSGSIDPAVDFAQTAELNTNFPLSDSFVFQEQCSGIKAVCITSGGRISRAQRASGLRLPAIGVTSGNVNSGSTGRVFYLGGVGRTTTLAQNSGLNNGISGFQGLPLYVGSGGNIINLSGMLGTSSGAAFLSGNMQQQIGIAISGGIFVMPSPRITRSGFRGTLPYDI